jgi:hypothetical protein
LSHSFKLIFISDEKELLCLNHTPQKVMSCRHFIAKLAGTVDQWINLATKNLLRRLQGRRKLGQVQYVGYNGEIYVALSVFLAASHRAENKSNANPAAERREDVAQDVSQSHGFDDQASHFSEDGRCRVDSVEDLIAALLTANQTRCSQFSEIALDRPQAGSGPPSDLPKMELFIWT